MKCRKCGIDLGCPCPVCVKAYTADNRWVWLEDGNHVKCPKCGYWAFCDEFFGLTIKMSDNASKTGGRK